MNHAIISRYPRSFIERPAYASEANFPTLHKSTSCSRYVMQVSRHRGSARCLNLVRPKLGEEPASK